MFLIVYYLIVSALAAKCSESQTNCANEKCETVGKIEVCTECNAGNVPIDGKCTQVGDAKEKCKKAEGSTPIGESDTKCGKCEGVGIFLFMGGCYSTTSTSGSEICTAAEGGKCTTCKTDTKYIFQNPAKPSTPGSECILCSDATGANEYKGVANCQTCTAPAASGSSDSNKKATCTACAGGYFISSDGSACTACNHGTNGVAECAACVPRTDDPTKAKCTACSNNKIVKTDNGVTSCIEPAKCKDGFFVDTAANPNKCTACTDENCATCDGGAGKCTKCKAAVDNKYLKKGDTVDANTCVSASACTTGALYYTDDTDTTENGKTCKSCAEGVPNCKTCTKEGNGNTVTCSACLEGFFIETVAGSGTSSKKCTACADSNCATCDGGADQCSKCKDGFNLESGKCMPPNTNRSGLSTGAIAGISVAAVVVVGGLVGFLCWWFICRGKA